MTTIVSPKEKEYLCNSLTIFNGLDALTINKLLEFSYFQIFSHKKTICSSLTADKGLFIVVNGAVKVIQKTLKKNTSIVNILSTNDVIYTNSFVSFFKITAMGKAQMLFIPLDVYNRVWSSNLQLIQKINNNLISQIHCLYNCKSFQSSPLKIRVANLILELFNKNSNKRSETLPMPVTRQDLADALNVTVESVIRIMSTWTHSNIIKSLNQKIQIIDHDFLNKTIFDED